MQTLADIDFAALTQRSFHPSPAAWADQVFYFFRVNRFFDGNAVGSELMVDEPCPEWRAVWLELPAAGCAVYGQAD